MCALFFVVVVFGIYYSTKSKGYLFKHYVYIILYPNDKANKRMVELLAYTCEPI